MDREDPSWSTTIAIQNIIIVGDVQRSETKYLSHTSKKETQYHNIISKTKR